MNDDIKKSIDEVIDKIPGDEETKKILKETHLESDFWWIMILFALFAFPFGKNDSSMISYLNGKIDAYEKMLGGK